MCRGGGAFFTSALERVGIPYALTSAHRKGPFISQIRECVKTNVGMDVSEKKVLSSAGIERRICVSTARRLTTTSSGLS